LIESCFSLEKLIITLVVGDIFLASEIELCCSCLTFVWKWRRRRIYFV